MNKQQLIAKYGKKFVASKSEAADVLKGVHYAADGSVFATNRHYGLRIRNAHSFTQALTLDVKGSPIKGEFPQNYERIFPQSHKGIIRLPVGEELNTAVRSAQMMSATAELYDKKLPIVRISIANGSTSLAFKNGSVNAKAFLGNTGSAKTELTLSINANYLLTALQLFKDAGRDASVWLNGPLNPIMLTDGEDIDVIILPYRTTD